MCLVHACVFSFVCVYFRLCFVVADSELNTALTAVFSCVFCYVCVCISFLCFDVMQVCLCSVVVDSEIDTALTAVCFVVIMCVCVCVCSRCVPVCRADLLGGPAVHVFVHCDGDLPVHTQEEEVKRLASCSASDKPNAL